MKEKAIAFNTKDQTFRELKRPQVFIPRLTGHSGKMSEALVQEMKIRKESRVATSLARNPSSNEKYYGTPNKEHRYNINRLQGNSSIHNSSKIVSPK